MKIHAPIYLNGFQRGGTNIFQNLVASHPEVIAFPRESHEIFYGNAEDSGWRVAGRRLLYFPLYLLSRQHTFGIYELSKRNANPFLVKYTRKVFEWELSKAITPDQKNPDVLRPVIKNVNCVTLNTNLFNALAPEAQFIGLVRNGLAICEGFVRRGGSAARVGKVYQRVCEQMIADSAEYPNYKLYKFEDMILHPQEFILGVYDFLDLKASKENKYRLQAKKSMEEDGTRDYKFGGEKDREVHWFSGEELKNQFRGGVNDNQISNLGERDKEDFLVHAAEVMVELGYEV